VVAVVVVVVVAVGVVPLTCHRTVISNCHHMVTFLLAAALLARTVVHGDVYGRVDPDGAALVVGAFHRSVYAVDEAERLDARYVQVGGTVVVTPAYVAPGAYVEVAPAPFVVLRVGLDAFGFLGVPGGQGLLRFHDATHGFGSEALASLAGDERTGLAGRASASLTLRAKWGPLIPRVDVAASAYRFADPGPYLYESEHDTLLAPADGLLEGRAALLVQAWRAGSDSLLVAGPVVEATRTAVTGLARTRVGALGYFVPVDVWGALRRPHVFATGGVDAVDPNHAGEPYAVLGVGAEWE